MNRLSKTFITALLATPLALSCCRSQPDRSSRWNYNHGSTQYENTPAYLPAADLLVFDLSTNKSCCLFAYHLKEQKLVQITSPTNISFSPVVSPDGKYVAFTREAEGYQSICLQPIESNGTKIRAATAGRVIDRPLRFSADSRALYFQRASWRGRLLLPRIDVCRTRFPFASNQVVILRTNAVDVSSSEEFFISENPSSPAKSRSDGWSFSIINQSDVTVLHGNGYSARLSPSGSKVLWVEIKGREPLFTTKLVVLDRILKSSNETELPLGVITQPDFSLDENYVVFRTLSSERGAEPGIYILDVTDLGIKKYIRIADIFERSK